MSREPRSWFTISELYHAIENVNYIAYLLLPRTNIEAKIFQDAIVNLEVLIKWAKDVITEEGLSETSFWFAEKRIYKTVYPLLLALAENEEEFINKYRGWRRTSGKYTIDENLNDVKKVVFRRDSTEENNSHFWYQTVNFELGSALLRQFPDRNIPPNTKIVLKLREAISRFKKERATEEALNHVILLADGTSKKPLDKIADDIKDVLNRECAMECISDGMSMFLFGTAFNRIDIDRIRVELYKENNHRDSMGIISLEDRLGILNSLHELKNNLLAEIENGTDTEAMIKEVLVKAQESSHPVIFQQKLRTLLLTSISGCASILITGYSMFTDGIPLEVKAVEPCSADGAVSIRGVIKEKTDEEKRQGQSLFDKYQTLAKSIEAISSSKKTTEAITDLMGLLEADDYHDCDYAEYKRGFIPRCQQDSIGLCKIALALK